MSTRAGPHFGEKFIARPLRVWLYPQVKPTDGWIFLPETGVLWHIDGAIVNRSRLQIFYSGNVQGVGFRYTVKSVATGFEVTGTVRNLPDGRVELVAEGAKNELKGFQQAIRESGLEHFIRDEHVLWIDPQDQFRGFEIVR